MENLKVAHRSRSLGIQVNLRAMLLPYGLLPNLKNLCSYLMNRVLDKSENSFRISYAKKQKQELLKALKNLGYPYEYVDPDGLSYLTNSTKDEHLDWRFRSIPKLESIVEDTETAPELYEIFGDSFPCVNIYMRYTDKEIFRINLTKHPESEKGHLIRALESFGFFDQKCQLYYHGALSYVFETNKLVQVRVEPDEEEFIPVEIFTYRRAITLNASFLDDNYEELLLDRSVFILENVAFGFYDCGINIIPLKGNEENMQNALIGLGYALNEHGFYEIQNTKSLPLT